MRSLQLVSFPWRFAVMVGAAAVALAMLGACASQPANVPTLPPAAFDDQAYGPPLATPTSQDIFGLTPAMSQYLRGEAAEAIRRQGPLHGLVDALYQQGRLKLDYDNSQTRTASEAFEARSGNCLSLVLMTAALAKELGLQVRFQDLQSQAWERSELPGLDLTIGHVNILIGRPMEPLRGLQGYSTWLLVDFLARPETGVRSGVPIEEARVIAMLLNNRAGEALVAGDLRGAYWHARAALHADANFAHAWNTLGVVHGRRQLTQAAEIALRQSLQLDSRHDAAMGNLASVLTQQGRPDEAAYWLRRQSEVQPEHPMALYQTAQQAMARAEWTAARRLLQRAIKLAGDWHELHFALARTYAATGDLQQTRRHLALAQEYGSTPVVRSRYASKLERLQTQH